MTDLTLSTHTRHIGEIMDAVLASDDHRAFVFTPADPIPPRRIVKRETPDGYNVHAWEQDASTFTRVKRVSNWGWLRRVASGYGEPSLVHPTSGCAFYVRTWRYEATPTQGNRRRTGGIIPHQRVSDVLPHRDCVFIARLSDGRYFADAWADRSVLYDALSRWKNARGYLCDWQEIGMHDPPTCAIGGADWKTIPDMIAEHRARAIRARELTRFRAVEITGNTVATVAP